MENITQVENLSFKIIDEVKKDIKEIVLKKNNGRCDKIIFEMPKISQAQIDKAYNGKPGCMCGCLGKYSVLKSSKETEELGETVSPRSVNFVLNKLIKEAKRGIEVIGDYIYLMDIEDRRYALYLKK
ncbi:MAG: hypothetical protein WC346_03580 [Methanogenium sp.]|jgi:hypothetical protein